MIELPQPIGFVEDREQIPTPAVLIDLPTAERNVREMAAYTRTQGLCLRPHTKTHKLLAIAKLQVEAGANGLTVAKVGEAETMASVSEDLMVAYPIVDRARVGRIAALAKQRSVQVAVDSLAACDALSRSALELGVVVGILVDIDVGFHRTGVQDIQESLCIAEHAERTEGLRLDGIMCFPGHLNIPPQEQDEPLRKIDEQLKKTIEAWRYRGLEPSVISGGSTPTARQSHLVSSLTEIRPGTYVFNDWNCVSGGFCELKDCAATVACTVVSDAVSGKVVLDAGSKTLTSDRSSYGSSVQGYGHVVEYPEARIVRLSEEHGEMDVTACEAKPEIGERVHVIPNHICPVVNLQESLWLGHQNGSFERVRVDARGLLS